jgi:hypothetical protein
MEHVSILARGETPIAKRETAVLRSLRKALRRGRATVYRRERQVHITKNFGSKTLRVIWVFELRSFDLFCLYIQGEINEDFELTFHRISHTLL